MYSYRAHVDRIIDGDTFEAVVDVGFYHSCRQRFRLMGYNAPETRGPEREMGKLASEVLALGILGLDVTLHTHKGDAFGRWLADVTLPNDGGDLVDWLVKRGYGVRWDGKGERPAFDPDLPYPLTGGAG